MAVDLSEPHTLWGGRLEGPLRAAGLAAACFVAALVCIHTTRHPGSLAFIWLPNALAVAALLRSPGRHVPWLYFAFLVAVGLANLAYGDGLSMALALTALNGFEVALGFGVARRGGELGDEGIGVEQGLYVLGATSALAPGLTGLIAGVAMHEFIGTPVSMVLAGWWTSSAIGSLFVLPIVLTRGIPLFETGVAHQERVRAFGLVLLTAAMALVLLLTVDFPFAYIAGVFSLMTFLYGPAAGSQVGIVAYGIFALMVRIEPNLLLSHTTEHGARAFWVGGAGSLIFPYVLGLMAQALRAKNAVLAEQMAVAASTRKDLEGLFAMMPDGALVVAEDGLEVLAANDAAHALFGYGPGELVGLRVYELAVGGDIAETLDHPRIEALSGSVGEGLYRAFNTALRKDGTTFVCESHFGPVHWEGRAASVSIARDVTRQRQLQLAVEEARIKAEETSRHKGEFLANMSHELRTPMNAVLGAAQLLEATPMSDPQRTYVDIILRSSNTLLAILKDILDFTQVEAGRLTLDPHEMLLEDMLSSVAPILAVAASDKEIETVIDLSPELPERVVGDALRLQQILSNLVSNAVKFTSEGAVTVRVTGQPGASGQVDLTVEVEDTGIGMSPEGLQRIFKPFSQAEGSTTRRFGGTGLGLVISRRLAELMGGEITVVSELGRGSTFTFRVSLPAASDDWGPRALKPVQGRRILMVDACPRAADSVGAWLEAWGADVHLAVDAEAALQLIRSSPTPLDAVVLDLQHVGGRGGEILAVCKDEAPPVPVVLLTTPQGQVRLSERTGVPRADALLYKPALPSALWDALVPTLTGRPPVSMRHEPIPGLTGALVGLTVLLAEDNLLNRTVAGAMLSHAGAVVIAVPDGRAAVDALRERPDGVDIVLMDVQMPELDGYGATRAIRGELGLDLPIIALTAGVLPSERSRCTAAGMTDFIGKPIELHELLRVVQRHARRAPEPPAPPPTTPALDLGPVLAVAGGDPAYRAAILGIVRSAVESGRAPIDELARAWALGQPQEAGRIYHRMRGFFGTLGAARLSNLAGRAEELILSGQPQEAERLSAEIAEELDAVLSAARAALGELEVRSPASAGI